jgi:hypothetical protein
VGCILAPLRGFAGVLITLSQRRRKSGFLHYAVACASASASVGMTNQRRGLEKDPCKREKGDLWLEIAFLQ